MTYSTPLTVLFPCGFLFYPEDQDSFFFPRTAVHLSSKIHGVTFQKAMDLIFTVNAVRASNFIAVFTTASH
jgi:hypothetical protein